MKTTFPLSVPLSQQARWLAVDLFFENEAGSYRGALDSKARVFFARTNSGLSEGLIDLVYSNDLTLGSDEDIIEELLLLEEQRLSRLNRLTYRQADSLRSF